jgi:WD40 repeat protein
MVLLGAESCGHGSARLWDILNGAETRFFPIPDSFNRTAFNSRIVFSYDGRYLLSDVDDYSGESHNYGDLIVWDVDSGREVGRIHTPPERISSMAFSPDSSTVIAGLSDGTVRLWDSTNGQEIFRFNGHIEQGSLETETIHSVGILPNGHTAISVSIQPSSPVGESEIILWNTHTGEEVYRVYEGDIVFAIDLATSPDGQTALIAMNGYNPAAVSTYWITMDVKSGQVLHRSAKIAESIYDIAFHPHDQAMLYVEGNRIILWDMVHSEVLHLFEGHSDDVHSIAFSPDGTSIVSGSLDGTVRLWDVATGQEIRRFVGHSSNVLSVAFASDGKHVLSVSSDSIVRLWRIDTPQEMVSWVCENRYVPKLTAVQRAQYGIPNDLMLCPTE